MTHSGFKTDYYVDLKEGLFVVDFDWEVQSVKDTDDVPGAVSVDVKITRCCKIEDDVEVPVDPNETGIQAHLEDEIYGSDVDEFDRRD